MSISLRNNYESDPVSPELRRRFGENQIAVLWESENSALPPSKEEMQGWHWTDIRPLAMETAKITLPAIIERRVMQLVNPTSNFAGMDATVGLINVGVQALMPGEHARPHRHSMNALRFILEGAGAETIVNGKPCLMEPGDLVTTPGWTWHEHRNVAGQPTIWVDILDAVIHRVFGTAVFQPGPIVDPQPAVSDDAFGGAGYVSASAFGDALPYSPIFRYRRADAVRALAAAPIEPDGSRLIRYTNPINGNPILPTLDCRMMQIDPGAATATRRSSASAVCVVVEGHGETKCGDRTFSWAPNDIFTVPQSRWVTHRCHEGPARLFIASNSEVYRGLGLLTEETQT